jgi:hypothetical protein
MPERSLRRFYFKESMGRKEVIKETPEPNPVKG